MAETELATIARPYARAAFSFALDQVDGLVAWSRMLSLLAATAREDIVRRALDDPSLSDEQGSDLLITVMGDELSEEGRNFVAVLSAYSRVELLPNIAEMFELLKANHEKTMDVEVSSAFEVTQSEKGALSKALNTRLQRDINLETSIDKSLIGGVVIKAEDTVIDDSVRGKIQKLSNVLG
ncbi:MAG: F0F1 ATP synthase subunit delta [Gammaproteobacteria bacterium]|jgi:F-type H+-transporting ATPase subunit delta|nr:F0F1 ATP synthase subunit delta [Gammaproteobacteria bacterium]|tara:strand:- start:1061 stop:1603 length:543 start_codon:yes stop_codon:yes gene_type:complete